MFLLLLFFYHAEPIRLVLLNTNINSAKTTNKGGENSGFVASSFVEPSPETTRVTSLGCATATTTENRNTRVIRECLIISRQCLDKNSIIANHITMTAKQSGFCKKREQEHLRSYQALPTLERNELCLILYCPTRHDRFLLAERHLLPSHLFQQ